MPMRPKIKYPLPANARNPKLGEDLPPACGLVSSERAFGGPGDGVMGEGKIIAVKATVLLSFCTGNGWDGHSSVTRG